MSINHEQTMAGHSPALPDDALGDISGGTGGNKNPLPVGWLAQEVGGKGLENLVRGQQPTTTALGFDEADALFGAAKRTP